MRATTAFAGGMCGEGAWATWLAAGRNGGIIFIDS